MCICVYATLALHQIVAALLRQSSDNVMQQLLMVFSVMAPRLTGLYCQLSRS